MERQLRSRNGLLLGLLLLVFAFCLIPDIEVFAADGPHLHEEDGVTYVYNASDLPMRSKWVEVDGNDYFTDENGAVLKDQFLERKGKTYYLGTDGVLAKGVFTVGKKTYCSNPSTGALYKEQTVVGVDGAYYLTDANSLIQKNKFVTISGNMYYFGSSGKAETGVVKVKNNYYFAKANGVFRTSAGWVQDNDTWYYVEKGGKILRNTIVWSKNVPYHVGNDGAVSGGAYKVKGVLKFFGKDGKLTSKVGWLKWDNKWYYIDKGAVVRVNRTAGSGKNLRYMGADGTYSKGIAKVGGKYYAFKSNGQKKTAAGWVKFGRKWYYAGQNGALKCKEVLKLRGKVYYFDENALMVTGLCEVNGKLRYFDVNGVMQQKKGWIQIRKDWYYSNKNGVLYRKAKVSDKGNYYYLGEDGKMLTGLILLKNNKAYYAKKNGALIVSRTFTLEGLKYYADAQGVVNLNRAYGLAQQYDSNTGHLIMVDLSKQTAFVFKGKKGDWIQEMEFSCSTGTSAHPTPTGSFQTTMRTKFFDSFGYRCWYATGFIRGEYLFHSSPYMMGDEPKTCADYTMGRPSSHGCIRLKLENALWIYNNVEIGTKVVIFK